jgi:hypothetical protein
VTDEPTGDPVAQRIVNKLYGPDEPMTRTELHEPAKPLVNAAGEPLARAPWTESQLESLRGYQLSSRWHPYTCGRCRSLLYPETDGWHCSGDDYAQDWAHEFTTDWYWLAGSGGAVFAVTQAVQHAVASAYLAGVTFNDEWVEVLNLVALGNLTAEEAIELAKRGPIDEDELTELRYGTRGGSW